MEYLWFHVEKLLKLKLIKSSLQSAVSKDGWTNRAQLNMEHEHAKIDLDKVTDDFPKVKVAKQTVMLLLFMTVTNLHARVNFLSKVRSCN